MSLDGNPSWNAALAKSLDGATVLVGLTHQAPAGNWTEQFFGTVMSVDANDGIVLRLEGKRAGEMITLPPQLQNFETAVPGEYRLRQTGELVTDPDYTAEWTISRAPN